MFIDALIVFVKAGNGGSGSCSFRREKFIAKGGPDGGDGGKGGNVIAVGNENLNSLSHFRHKKMYIAKNGENGSGNNRTGHSGKDITLHLPLGSIIFELKDNQKKKICEITKHNQKIILAQGGLGGRGNAKFKSAINRTPRKYQTGLPGDEHQFKIELKLIADVGLVGFPNAGKSTLISTVSSATPKIADYEFTTLFPNLGVVHVNEYKSYLMADIPGIIEGASIGKGMGFQFLKHIQRTKILLFLIDVGNKKPKDEFFILKSELHNYDPDLDKKEHLVVLSKSDTLSENKILKIKKQFDEKVIAISSVTNKNLSLLNNRIIKLLEKES